jgi:hypothetical protein
LCRYIEEGISTPDAGKGAVDDEAKLRSTIDSDKKKLTETISAMV